MRDKKVYEAAKFLSDFNVKSFLLRVKNFAAGHIKKLNKVDRHG